MKKNGRDSLLQKYRIKLDRLIRFVLYKQLRSLIDQRASDVNNIYMILHLISTLSSVYTCDTQCIEKDKIDQIVGTSRS